MPRNFKIRIVGSGELVGDVATTDPVEKIQVVLRVTLISHEQYAIDLSGAQYGYHQECTEWNDFFESRVEEVKSKNALGSAKECLAIAAAKWIPIYQARKLTTFFGKKLWHSVQLWTRKEISIDNMLALPDDEYEAKKESLLESVGRYMEHSKEESIDAGLFPPGGPSSAPELRS